MAKVPYSIQIYGSREELEFENRKRFLKKLSRVGFAYAKGVGESTVAYPHSLFFHITLTFKNIRAYRECVKVEGVSQLNRWMRKEVQKLGGLVVSHMWVLEVQERGIPHYHYLLQVLPFSKGFYLPSPDLHIWKYGSTRVQRVKVLRGGVMKYISGYLGKEHQKEYGRFRNELRGKRKYDVRSYGIFMRFFAVRLTRARMGYVLRLLSDELLEMPHREDGYWVWKDAGIRYRRRCFFRFEDGRCIFVDFGFELAGPSGFEDVSGSEMDDARMKAEKGEFWLEALMLKSLARVVGGV